MLLARLLLLLLAVVVALAWLRRRAGGGRQEPAAQVPPASADGGAGTGTEPSLMVVCEVCGLHLPEADACLSSSGQVYCCDAHRDAARD